MRHALHGRIRRRAWQLGPASPVDPGAGIRQFLIAIDGRRGARSGRAAAGVPTMGFGSSRRRCVVRVSALKGSRLALRKRRNCARVGLQVLMGVNG